MNKRGMTHGKRREMISFLGLSIALFLLLFSLTPITSAESTSQHEENAAEEEDASIGKEAQFITNSEDKLIPVSEDELQSVSEDEVQAEWIIKWKEGSAIPSSSDFTVVTVDEERSIMLIKLKPDVELEEWYAEWIEKEEIEYIEPDHTLKISFRPNDPSVTQQQYLSTINAFQGWEMARDNNAIIIAVLDTGVDLEHPDLKDNLVPGINLIERSKPPQDDNGHGTQVAGVLGAKGNNNQGVAGILWSSKIMPVKVLDKEGEGTPFRVAQGIYESIDKGASIVLLSLGDPVYSQTLLDAVEKAEEAGVLVVAATGNEGARVNYPAAFPSVLAVGAVNAQDRVVSYSNAGPEVNLVAVGNVYTTRLGGGYGAHSGTSMAAPQVAGLAALVWKQYPTLKPSELRNHLMYTAKDVHSLGWDPQTGHGRIDMAKALQTRPINDIYEPNNAMGQATVFPIESMIRAELRNKDDLDWFELNAPYRGQITLSISLDIAKASGVDLTFYPGEQGEQSFLYNIKKEREITLSVPKGKSYLRLKYNHNERRATPLKYTMRQTFTIYQDNQQPNHTKGLATPLAGNGQVVTGTFHRNYLNHWYYFDAPQEGEIDLSITVDTLRLDPVLYYERPDGRSVTIDEGSVQNGQEEHFVTRVQPGRHYFRVNHYYGHQVNGEYYLRLRYRPMTEDIYEPNNRMSEASSLRLGQQITATIHPKSDLDWYQVSIGQNRYLQIQVSGIPEQVGLEVKLFNQHGGLIASRKQLPRERSFMLGDKLDAGQYYVVVSADREFPFSAYSLRVDAQELLFGFRDISGHWAVYDIVEAARTGLVQGVGDYRFAPNEGMNRAAAATLIHRWYSFPQATNRVSFKDVSHTHWAATSIYAIVQEGIIQGFPDGTFRPEQSITRAEVAVVMDRLLKNSGRVQDRNKYVDVPERHWAYTSIMRLSQAGLLTGYQDGTFRPNQPMTRAEFVTLIQRLNKR